MSDAVAQIRKTLNPLVSKAKMRARLPLPVWDDTGTLIGVSIECDKLMGGKAECLAQATFTLSPQEIRETARLKAKIELAIAALKSEVLVTIRHKKAQKAA